MEMNALVLSGGGAKGSYQVGVWKALRKLKIDIDLVTGTSVGALNGAFITQNTYRKCVRLWKNAGFNTIFGENIDFDLEDLRGIDQVAKLYGKNIIDNHGMDTSRLQSIIDKYLNKKKFMESPTDFGFITFNLSTNKPLIIKKKEVDVDKLSDYLTASASCFPAFKMKDIDGEKYIDGGYFDNVPINLAIEMGDGKLDKIIVVDLEAPGLKRKTKKIKDNNLLYIKPRNDIGNFLLFDKKNHIKNIKYGYNDTLKLFNKLEGDKYSFKPKSLERNYEYYKDNFAYVCKRMITLDDKRLFNQLVKIANYKKLLNNNFDDYKEFNKIIEYLGEVFEIPDYNIYNVKLFNHILKTKLINYSCDNLIDINSIKKLKLNDSIDHKFIVKSIYKFMLKPIEFHKELSKVCILFPKEFLASLYLYTII